MIEDEDIQRQYLLWLRGLKPSNHTASKLRDVIDREIIPTYPNSDVKRISRKIASDWLNNMKFLVVDSELKKGSVYVGISGKFTIFSPTS